MLNHSYKVLSQCVLARIETEIAEDFLPSWQIDFRAERGCRDNVLLLRTIYDYMLENGHQLFATFIDFSAAFDSLSHKFIDQSLEAAGVSDKTRSMFRAIYRSATARTAVEGIDGETILSDLFPVKRGVVQGDVNSSMYFILALALIMRIRHATRQRG